MRPLHLTLTGFRSHHKAADFDFSGRSLMAIVGPTGAGKSSILDGIAFALYGKTPREQRSTKRLICNRSSRADVILRFEVDGTDWEVTRVISQKGASEHVLVDCSSDERISGEANVNMKIQELIGLDFGAFCSSVLLAQGRFDRFLSATATERTKILKGLFRLERIEDIGRAAKERSRDIETEIARIQGGLDLIPADAVEQLAAAKKEVERAVARAQELTEALPTEKRLLDLHQGAAEHIAKLTDREKELERAVSGLPEEASLNEFAGEETRLQEAMKGAEKATQSAGKAHETAVEQHSGLQGEIGTEVALAGHAATASELTSTQKRIATATKVRSAAEARVAALASDVVAAEKRASEADDAREAAAAARAELESAHRAHVLREHLVAGEPCPVCEQEVATVPVLGSLPALTDARAQEKAAVAAHETAQKELLDVRATVGKAENELATAVRDIAALAEDEKGRKKALKKALGDVDDPGAEIERRQELLAASDGRLREALVLLEQAKKARDACRHEIEGRDAERRKMFGLISMASAIARADPPQDDAPEALVAAARAARKAIHDDLEGIAAELTERRRSAAETESKVAELRAELGLDSGMAISDAKARVQGDERVAQKLLEGLTEALGKRKKLAADRKALKARQDVFDTLSEDMRPARFTAFLLEERSLLLAELASERFREISGRYSFVFAADELAVVDELAADTQRSVSSLSGGETFLASLALALALAELVTREGGRLQCFFLDEGFGSLDPESFDMAMDGIEHLVTGDRLIGLVSHVDALKARVEDKIVLAKAPDGTTIVVDDPGDPLAAIAAAR